MMIRKTQGWEKASQRKHKIIVSNKTAHPFWCCEAAGWQHQLHIKTEFAISQSPGPSAHTTVTPLFHSHRKTELLCFSTFLACSFFSFKPRQKRQWDIQNSPGVVREALWSGFKKEQSKLTNTGRGWPPLDFHWLLLPLWDQDHLILPFSEVLRRLTSTCATDKPPQSLCPGKCCLNFLRMFSARGTEVQNQI